MECKICNHPGHSSHSCHELYAPLYGKFGEGASKNQGHDHEEDSLCVRPIKEAHPLVLPSLPAL